jgi:thiamine-phosphate pyrophosphorylase
MKRLAVALDRFYPIVPDSNWLERIAPCGIRTVQLRVKNLALADVRREISHSLAIAKRYQCQLIVNDYWQEAIDAGADFVHLGQEDLAEADVAALRAAGVRIGVSTHDEHELQTALAMSPDYVALGPIFETKLKAMTWAPQGLDRISLWKQRIGAIPLVAIGGLNFERATSALDAGADSAAVITDFVTHDDPVARVSAWVAWSERSVPHEAR